MGEPLKRSVMRRSEGFSETLKMKKILVFTFTLFLLSPVIAINGQDAVLGQERSGGFERRR